MMDVNNDCCGSGAHFLSLEDYKDLRYIKQSRIIPHYIPKLVWLFYVGMYIYSTCKN